MKTLVIVESPSKAKTIEKYLGNDYIVRASVGHIRDIPKSNKDAIDIEGGFIPRYIIPKEKEKVVSDLKQAARKASEILLATDPDREGEAIAWHVAQALDLSSKNTRRVVFHEITKDAVSKAISNPRDIDDNLRRAQEARRVLDRIVGYDLSGLIWKKIRYGLSAGRVQSPALRILMEREREIKAFIAEKYWIIYGNFTHSNDTLSLVCSKEPRDEKEAETIVSKGKNGKWNVIDVSETKQKRSARAPFTTSTLQQAASSRLGFSPSRTMGIAQKLYEAGLITYMRTDSTIISKEAETAIGEFVRKKFGNEYSTPKQYKTKSKNAQEAHEAIRPTNIKTETAGIVPEQKKLYELIWNRAVSSQMADALLAKTKITANINEGGIPDFTANGSRLIFNGWLAADKTAQGDDILLPQLKPGENISLVNISLEGKETKPPARYSEAGLVKELEKRDIGRPSTYASIMKTLSDRGYVIKENKTLIPTDTGEVVENFLEEHFPKYISDIFTAEMENELDDIAAGKREYTKTLSDFYKPFHKAVISKEDIPKVTTLGDAPSDIVCPECEGGMIIKLGKNGKFLSCKSFPLCAGARTIEGKAMEPPKDLGIICPKCEKGKLVERDGRYGKFIACSLYPKCKFVKQDEEEEAKKNTGVKCPMCKNGAMIERRGRFGIFYSCSNYPDCKNAIKARPTGAICQKCGSLMMDGTKTIPERCSNKSCQNHNPHKLKGSI